MFWKDCYYYYKKTSKFIVKYSFIHSINKHAQIKHPTLTTRGTVQSQPVPQLFGWTFFEKRCYAQ